MICSGGGRTRRKSEREGEQRRLVMTKTERGALSNVRRWGLGRTCFRWSLRRTWGEAQRSSICMSVLSKVVCALRSALIKVDICGEFNQFFVRFVIFLVQKKAYSDEKLMQFTVQHSRTSGIGHDVDISKRHK